MRILFVLYARWNQVTMLSTSRSFSPRFFVTRWTP